MSPFCWEEGGGAQEKVREVELIVRIRKSWGGAVGTVCVCVYVCVWRGWSGVLKYIYTHTSMQHTTQTSSVSPEVYNSTRGSTPHRCPSSHHDSVHCVKSQSQF